MPVSVPVKRKTSKDAQSVADKLDIPLHTIDLRKQYRENILGYFKNEYLMGNTPNPCARCNRDMKFTAIMEELERRNISYDYFATGHYARVQRSDDSEQVRLKKALYTRKDQSYFLYHLKEEQLKSFMFPLGEYEKSQIRDFAREFQLVTAEKPESQDFISGGYHQLFDSPGEPGPIINTTGDVLGQHKGLIYYAVGQRKGIGISSERPLYVIKKDANQNAIIVGHKEELMGTCLIAKEMSWVNMNELTQPMQMNARIRYLTREVPVEVSPIEGSSDRVRVTFYEAQSAISPGQVVVFYDEDVVMGGGIIEQEVRDDR